MGRRRAWIALALLACATACSENEPSTAPGIVGEANALARNGHPRLIAAILEEDVVALRQLLAAGADPNAHTGEGLEAESALVIATESDDELAVMLLDRGATLRPGEGPRALVNAAARGSTRTLQRLLEQGVPPNTTSEEAPHALLVAASEGHLECIRILLAAGASIEASELVASAFDSENPVFIDALLAELPEANPPEDWFRRVAWMQTGAPKNAWIDSLIARFGKPPQAELDQGLKAAAGWVDPELADYMISLGGRPPTEGFPIVLKWVDGTLGLVSDRGIEATAPDAAAILEKLIAVGADLDETDMDERAPLATAVADGPRFVTELLLEHGVDPIGPFGVDGRSAIMAAIAGRIPVERLSDLEVIRFEGDNGTPDEAEARAGSSDGESPEAQRPNFDPREPDLAGIVARLLEAGVDVDHRDARGQTALHLAQRAGDRALIAQLLAAGADPTLRDHAGRTPAEFAEPQALRATR